MTWHTLEGRRLTDPGLAEKFRRVAREIEARNAEAKANPPPPTYDNTKPPVISKNLRPIIAKIAAELQAAQVTEDEQ